MNRFLPATSTLRQKFLKGLFRPQDGWRSRPDGYFSARLRTPLQNLLPVLLLFLALGLAGCQHETAAPTLRALVGHDGDVNSAVFSPDGRMIATASIDQTIKLWDMTTDKETLTLRGHTAVVACAVFSPDGKMLASGSWDQTVKLWDTATGKILHTLPGHTLGVLSVAFSPDGKRVASGSSDHTVIVWDAMTGHLLHTLNDAENPVAFSPDGSLLVTGSEMHILKVWDATKWQLENRFEGHDDSLLAAAFSPDGKLAGSGSADTNAILWNIPLRHQAHTLRIQLGLVRSVTFTLDGKVFLAGAGRVVQFYDVATGRILHTLQTPFDYVTSVAISPDAKTLAVAGAYKDGTDPALTTKRVVLYPFPTW